MRKSPASCERRLAPVDEEARARRRPRCRARARSATLEPTALTCAPGESHSPRRTGSRDGRRRADDVGALDRLADASRTASTAMPWRFDSRSAKARAPLGRLGSRRARGGSCARASIASRCVRACTPEPRSARSPASSRARSRVASAAHGGGADGGDRRGVDDREEAARAAPRTAGRRPGASRARCRRCAGRRSRPSAPTAPAPRGSAGIRPSAPRPVGEPDDLIAAAAWLCPGRAPRRRASITSMHSFIGRRRGTSLWLTTRVSIETSEPGETTAKDTAGGRPTASGRSSARRRR